MTTRAEQADQCPDEMQILAFTVMGVRMGIDTSQIEEMLEVDQAIEQGLSACPIHEEFPFGPAQAAYYAPKVITLKDRRRPLALVIDQPDEITAVPVDSIQPLPMLIAARPGASRAIWGAVVRNEDVILLVDFLKLSAHKAEAQKSAQARKIQ